VPTTALLKIAVAAVAVLAAAAAAILLNLTLLGHAQPRNDPVGKLSPRAVLTPGGKTPAVPVMPVVPAAPARPGDHRGEQDD
jgi:hypothetical protein